MKTTQKTVGWYHVMAAVTVMIWGTTFVATKVLIKYGLSPVDILFYRFLLAYICIWFSLPVCYGPKVGRTNCGLWGLDCVEAHSILLPKTLRWG